MNETIVVRGTRRSMKELVDGTIRVQIDIDPPFRKTFMEHFGDIDMPVALAPLTAASTFASPAPVDTTATAIEERVKGGELSRLAGIWCGDPQFRLWVERKFCQEMDTADHAADKIREVCAVESRAELDHNREAAALFDQHFRIPYSQYLKENA